MHTIREAKEVNKLAREVFARDGNHTPIVILYKGKETRVLGVGPLMQSGATKEALSGMIRMAIKQMGVSGVVMITEAWMHKSIVKPDGSMDDETKQIMDGKKSVSEADSKTEVLMVQAESDDGLNVTFMNPIVRDAEGKPTLAETQVMDYTMKGRFGGFFTS
jgi:hypothetical protein